MDVSESNRGIGQNRAGCMGKQGKKSPGNQTAKKRQQQKTVSLKLKKKKLTKQKHKRKRLWLWGITAVAFLLALWGRAAERQVRVTPDYLQVDISGYLDREEWTEEEYSLLFQQTGLAPSGVDALRGEGRQEELLVLQKKLFAQTPFICRANTILTREEIVAEEDRTMDGNGLAESAEISAGGVTGNVKESYASIPYVEEGDILITFNTHFLGWRNGHAAMVVDAKKELTLEASVLGSDTTVMSLEHWKRYPSFVVLRLKDADREERGAIAAFALEQMTGVPYHLTAGWGDWLYAAPGSSPQESQEGNKQAVSSPQEGQEGNKQAGSSRQEGQEGSKQAGDSPQTEAEKSKNAVSIQVAESPGQAVSGTQCAHLVWYAYDQFGYDLDSDGGLIVTPRDLYESRLLEVVQVYGMRIVP